MVKDLFLFIAIIWTSILNKNYIMSQKTSHRSSLFILSFFMIFFGISCNRNAENTKQVKPPDKIQTNDIQSIGLSDDDILKRGQDVYNRNCLTCHQENGSGVPMMYPPITESDFISGDNEKLIKLILKGMSGPIEIKTELYNSIMPPQNNLDDQQISALITYLRSTFSNSGKQVSTEEVTKVRESLLTPINTK